MTEGNAAARLPLDSWHRAQGARMVGFAGYDMPLHYEGIVGEHLWTRAQAALFDVSHMGQIIVSGPGAANALGGLLPADLSALKPGRLRYSLLLDDTGGILDDLMITRLPEQEDGFYLVVNGARFADDLAWLGRHLAGAAVPQPLADRALLALQGPRAAQALSRLLPGATDNWYLIGGLGLILGGIVTATQLH